MNFRQQFFGLVILFVLFLSCSREKAHSPPNAVSPGGTLRISASAETETLDPQKILFLSDMQIVSFIYEGLVGIDNHLNPVPLLAERWEKFDNGRRIRFHLRKNVRFQDDACFPGGIGRTLTAEDVRFTFQRIADPAVKCPNRYLFEGKIVGMDAFCEGKSPAISGIRVLAPDEIEFHLTKAYFSFLKLLAAVPAQIVPREAVVAYGANLGHHPVGTGPFRLARWKSLKEILLVKNDHYWQKDEIGNTLPYIEALQIRLISNPVLRISEFLKGNLDVIRVQEKDAVELQKQPHFQQKFRVDQKNPNLDVRFFGFSLDKKTPLSREPQLRQAIVRAFRRDKLNDNSPLPVTLAKSFVPDFLLNHHEFSWYPYTPETARQLVQKLSPASLHQTIEISSNIKSAEADLLCQAIRRLGLRCKTDIHPVKYYAHILKDRPDIFRVSFFPNYPDAEDYYALFYSGNIGGINLTSYQNPEFDSHLKSVLFEQNADVRQELFIQMEKILSQDIPAIYLVRTPPDYILTSRRIHGLGTKITSIDFQRAWIGK